MFEALPTTVQQKLSPEAVSTAYYDISPVHTRININLYVQTVDTRDRQVAQRGSGKVRGEKLEGRSVYVRELSYISLK